VAPAQARSKLHVLSTIRPLDLLVADIAGDSAEHSYLVRANASPHNFSMRISDLDKLKNADLIVWVGPNFERFLSTNLQRGALADRSVELDKLPDLHWPETAAAQQGRDLHLWLNSDNAEAIARAVTARLIELDPEAAQGYRARLRVFVEQIGAQKKRFLQRFDGKENIPFSVYHDGYSHFTSEFGLRRWNFVTEIPEQQLSLKQLHQLSHTTQSSSCLLADSSEWMPAKKMADTLGLPVQEVDLLAHQQQTFAAASEQSQFVRYWKALGEAFLNCLEKKSPQRQEM